jgi:hypothetical protein
LSCDFFRFILAHKRRIVENAAWISTKGGGLPPKIAMEGSHIGLRVWRNEKFGARLLTITFSGTEQRESGALAGGSA